MDIGIIQVKYIKSFYLLLNLSSIQDLIGATKRGDIKTVTDILEYQKGDYTATADLVKHREADSVIILLYITTNSCSIMIQ